MKCTLIRTAEPAFRWERSYPAEEFDRAFDRYLTAPMLSCAEKPMDPRGRKIYTADTLCCRQTAEALFPDTPAGDVTATPLLDPRPLKAFLRGGADSASPVSDAGQDPGAKAAGPVLPVFLWRMTARLLQALGDPQQPESLRDARARAQSMIDTLEAGGRNCILIADEDMLRLLVRAFRRRGYHIRRGGIIRIAYLERIIAADNEPHCGGCMHDCPLSSPGCMIGREKAARRLKDRRTAAS